MIYQTVYQTAEHLKEILKNEFPATTFTVNVDENHILSNINILWKDGPLSVDVRRAVQ